MDTVNEHIPDLLTQAAELLTLFFDVFATDSIGRDDTEDAVAQGLEQYKAQVDSIAATAASCGDLGLQRVCVHYRALLTRFVSEAMLCEDVRLAMEEWPTLVMTYLEAPDDADLCTALLEHLQHPVWATPLSTADVEELRGLLMPAAMTVPASVRLAETPQDSALSPTDGPTDRAETRLAAAEAQSIPVSMDLATDAESRTTVATPAEAETSHSDLPEADGGSDTCLIDTAPATTADDSTVAVQDNTGQDVESAALPLPPEAWVCDVDLDLATPEALSEAIPPLMAEDSTEAEVDSDNRSETCLAYDMDEEPEAAPEDVAEPAACVCDPAPVSHEEADGPDEAVDELLDEPVDELLDEAVDAAADVYAASSADLEAGEPDATTDGLIELLCQEVLQLEETLHSMLTEAVAASDDWRQVLADHSEELERFGEGAAAMGLSGLQYATTHLCTHVMSLVAQETALNAEQRQVVQAWPALVLHYLQGRYEPATHAALAQYLGDGRWPEPLAEAEVASVQAALQQVELVMEEMEELPERPSEAQLADISLTLPEDVVPALLETLLQELPQQAAEFSAAIQRCTAGTGTLADVTVAQRIAHSLKGAANTVGVPGVANLTHHLEDILLAFAQHETLPTRPLCRTLTSAADCLEAMSEALSGASAPPPPEMTLGVFQEVLDWANLIDRAGVPRNDTTCPPERDVLPGLLESAVDLTTDTAQTPVSTATPGKRLDTDLVDGLLRLSGEVMILNSQLQDRLKRTVEQTRTVRAQNTIVQQLVWDLEQLVDIRGVTSPLLQRTPEGEFDPLEMEQYNELHTVSRRLLEAVTDALAVGRDVEGSLVTLDGLLHDQRRMQSESDEAIMRTRMVPVKTIVPRLQRAIRQACRLTEKEAELVLSGGETLVDSTVLNNLLDPLMHMLRNAVDHGIEAPEVREARGKVRTGTITLEFLREGNTVLVRCRDDGAGLDYDAIRRTALARGLLEAQTVLSDDDLGRLILQPGFSTRTQTTQVSGRGIGMDVVYSRIQELKGSLRLTSEAQRGCAIEIRLPVSLMSAHGLLVRSGSQVFAVADLGVEQILYPAAGTLRQDGERMLYEWNAEWLEATTLETLLNVRVGGGNKQIGHWPALLVRDDTGRHRIVLVQAVLDSVALVIKPLGRYIPPIPGLVGATILGDGSATAVLDLPELLRTAMPGHTIAGALQETVRLAERTLPVALVVDDSLSARRALADFIQDLGFEVHTAGDGLEAIASMARHQPDILLVDLEMPRMNGLELAEHVRVQHPASELPIIMITSRSTEKHRRNATRSGVDVYLVKPFSEDRLAEHIQQLMAQPSATVSMPVRDIPQQRPAYISGEFRRPDWAR